MKTVLFGRVLASCFSDDIDAFLLATVRFPPDVRDLRRSPLRLGNATEDLLRQSKSNDLLLGIAYAISLTNLSCMCLPLFCLYFSSKASHGRFLHGSSTIDEVRQDDIVRSSSVWIDNISGISSIIGDKDKRSLDR